MSLAQLTAYARVSRTNLQTQMGYCTSETLPFTKVTFRSLYT